MTKYLAAVLNLIALLVLGAVIVLLMKTPAPPRLAAANSAAAVPAPEPAAGDAMARLRELERGVGRISRLASLNPLDTAAPLAVGVDAPAPPAIGQAAAKAVARVEPEPAVSLIYLSPDLKKAVIDGDMVGVGERLSNGARVVSIDAERVTIETQGRRSTLPAPRPQIVGGVRTQREKAQ